MHINVKGPTRPGFLIGNGGRKLQTYNSIRSALNINVASHNLNQEEVVSERLKWNEERAKGNRIQKKENNR